MRQAGIRLFISYWGAPMSSLNSGLKLALKKIEVYFRRYKPDHFIFESNAMAETAIWGRGIPAFCTIVIPTGVDTEAFRPDAEHIDYAYKVFSINRDRKLFLYAGHFEERKGGEVIIKAANELIPRERRKDVHFILLSPSGIGRKTLAFRRRLQ
jgi:glycosyltransferase involved in cell wall biosynthesis